MSTKSKKVWSYSITNTSLVIDESFGLCEVSLILTSGTGTVKCNAITLNGLPSLPINLPVGLVVDVSSGSTLVLDEVEIITTGEVLILGR
jgi:hypothetical protein